MSDYTPTDANDEDEETAAAAEQAIEPADDDHTPEGEPAGDGDDAAGDDSSVEVQP